MKNYVSIITLNYNGRRYLKDFFNSVLDLDYPKDRYEVIMVDNNYTDDSVEFVKKNYTQVIVLETGKNLGFAGGNNFGMKRAKGDLFFLVNNDTILAKDALKNIVTTFERWNKNHKIGAVNAKLVLIDAYLPLVIEEAFYSDFKISPEVKPVNGELFIIPHEAKTLFTEKVFLPLKHTDTGGLKINFKIRPYRKSEFKIRLGDELLYRDFLKTFSKEQELSFKLSKNAAKKYKINLIQNAGNFYFRNGAGRDRGAVVIKHHQYYEPDIGQYDKEELVPGFCGAGVLLNKKALAEVGYFDESFFMYYEDGDLSLRMKEKGWRILYAPNALVRHIHAGSSKEWSDFFTYHVERGRLLFVGKHWPRSSALREWMKYFFKDTLGISFYYLWRGQTQAALAKLKTRLKVNIFLFPDFILGLFRLKRLSRKEVEAFL
jgi:GT2 family glycosyltransferase